MASTARKLQLTLAVIKPDVVAHPIKFQAIQRMIVDHNFLVVRSKILRWSRSDAERFYEEHRGRFFYNRLVGFMTCGPMCAQILAGDNVITRWRELMGPTKTFRAKHIQPDTIRGQHGLTDTRNATHGSDSPETASREIGFFFPEFSIQRWYEREEPLYRDESVPVVYCKELHLHIPRPADILLES
ncbi:nucleoside diphosphate kinase 6-like [Diadema antillarum]|uniref:nucleoside diphosphate kinase 6-like n=1 Tax=Diadema antillarum TaxID=105358 RepID=UPI003A8874D3